MKIGVLTRIYNDNNSRKEFVNQSYLSLLIRYNHIPIIISSFNNEEVLSLCDGFLIPGGDDVNPKLYYQSKNDLTGIVDDQVDDLDFKVLDHAFKYNKPILGICRGIQVINVYLGGSLVNHIEEDNHSNKQIDYLKFTKDSHFHDLRNKIIIINSYHHQKIDTLGKSLFIEAISNEAIEIVTSSKYKLIATQYHIEKINDQYTKLIMDYFLGLFSL